MIVSARPVSLALAGSLLAFTVVACAAPHTSSGAVGGVVKDDGSFQRGRAAADRADRATIERHARELAADRYEGRFPGTRGEELAVGYIERELRSLGLQPGNPDGSYVQRFDLHAQRSRATATLTIGGRTVPLPVPAEAAFLSTRPQPRTTIEGSELVFAGYGVVAPEHGWDDYAGVDVRGKTVLVMRDEPEPRLAGDGTRHDPALFRGAQLTRHGTLERKREVARERGAAAVLFLAAGVGGFRQMSGRFGGEMIMLGTEPWPPVIGVLAPEVKARLFAAAGREVRADSLAAGRRGFRAIPLGATLSLEVTSEWRRVPTRNVVARLEGSDPRLRDEHVVLSAHWDAFGIGTPVNGDSIYNGAVDDAVGVGQLLAAARAIVDARPRPRRSILFLVTSAEEQGLLGARHYVANPLHPLAGTVANVNFDIVALAGATRDVRMHGSGRSTLDDVVREAARIQGRRLEGDTTPQASTWFQQDHFAFVEAGVPALSVASGNDVIGRPAGYADSVARVYRMRDYHRPSDEVRADWDWGSIVQDARLGVLVALRYADGATRPRWLRGADVGTVAR